jgi:hypothetical protein
MALAQPTASAGTAFDQVIDIVGLQQIAGKRRLTTTAFA